MSATCDVPVELAPSGTSDRRDAWHLALLVSLVVTFLAGSSAPTPLYATYQQSWGFSLITTTEVFGVYALAVLAGLLVLGRLSDHVGRKPVIVGALIAQIAAMLVFTTAYDVDTLMAGRILQGLATGAALGAIGAAMLDLHPGRGTAANAAAPGAGTGLGAIASGLVVAHLPSPTHTIYLALAVLLAAQLAAIIRVLAPTPPVDGAWQSLVPELHVPPGVRGALMTAAPVLFAVWALAGFYGALGAALVHELSGHSSVVMGGLGLFLLAGTASVATLALRSVSPAALLRIGLAGLSVGVVGILVAISHDSSTAFMLATVVAGVGFGSGFQGALRSVVATTPAADRAGVLSMLYVVSYLGMGLPAVVAGWLVVHGHPLVSVAQWYAMFLLVLAAASALGTQARRTRPVGAASYDQTDLSAHGS